MVIGCTWNILLLKYLLFATFTWYSLDNPNSNKEAAAYNSVTITIIIIIIFLLIILYHVYTYTSLFSKIKKIKIGGMHDLDGPVNTDDHGTTLFLRPTPVEPTYSVVELPKPSDLAAPDPEEVANTQHVPWCWSSSSRNEGSNHSTLKLQIKFVLQ